MPARNLQDSETLNRGVMLNEIDVKNVKMSIFPITVQFKAPFKILFNDHSCWCNLNLMRNHPDPRYVAIMWSAIESLE